MQNIYTKGSIAMVAVLLVVFALVGCGGNPVVDPLPIPEDQYPDLSKMLEDQGLIVRLKTEKPDYKQGEPILFCFSVKNQGTQTHTIELRPWYWNEEGFTYSGSISYRGTDMWSDDLVFQLRLSDKPKFVIAPGNEIKLVEITWDQKTIQGTMAQPGFYCIGITLYNLYVDGHLIDDRRLASEVYKDNVIKVVE